MNVVSIILGLVMSALCWLAFLSAMTVSARFCYLLWFRL